MLLWPMHDIGTVIMAITHEYLYAFILDRSSAFQNMFFFLDYSSEDLYFGQFCAA